VPASHAGATGGPCTVLPGVGIPSPRDVPTHWELWPDELGLLVPPGAAGLVLASLLPPSSAGNVMLPRRDLEGMGSGALPGAGHGLAAGQRWAQGTWLRAGTTQTPTLGTRRRVLVCWGEERSEDAVPPAGTGER